MDIQNVDEFIEKPVISVNVELIGAPGIGWVIDDVPESQFVNGASAISFVWGYDKPRPEHIRVERRNVAWSSISHYIDRIPVKRPKAPTEPASSVRDANRP